MFHNPPGAVLERMRYLEQADSKDRQDGTEHLRRLRQIPPQTGRFLAILAAGAPEGRYLEIGTSAGYSTLWLALACREVGRTITTFELLEEKVTLAKETFKLAGVEDVVELVEGDARRYLPGYKDVAFCFLDAEKKHYQAYLDMVIPNMVKGGFLAADNVISHKQTLQPVVDTILNDARVDALVVPIGSGILVCRKT